MTHITYECAKRLKEFLGESAPEPMGRTYYWMSVEGVLDYGPDLEHCECKCEKVNRYALHDLLSKPFCEAFSAAMERKPGVLLFKATHVFTRCARPYYDGGLPAVEKALMEMMEAK